MRKCVVIADKAEDRESMASVLRREGVPVTLAGNPGEAVAALKSDGYDTALIFNTRRSDITARKLRSRIQEECNGCRVLILSRVKPVRGSRRLERLRLGEHVLTVPELIGLISAGPGSADDVHEFSPVESGVRALIQVVDVLIGLQELADRFFAGSSHRAMRLARAVAEELGLSDVMVHEVILATLLRDIGKAGVSENVLEASSDFSEDEMTEMQEHVTGSVRLLEHIDFPWKVLPVIRHHHEHYNGQGYPDGLKGPEIPLGARIVAAVDAYVAMLSGRSHRASLSSEQALEELERQAGNQFDPEVIEVLIRVVLEKDITLSAEQKPKVLVAHRDVEFLKLLKLRLLNAGLEVQTMTNVDEVAVHLLDDPPSLVLVEVDTDDERAFDLLQAIRGDESLRNVPLAFIAAQPDRILKVRALRHGVDDFLAKTEDLQELVARVENILIREASRRSKRASTRRRGVTGMLDSLPLPDIIQMLNMGMKTACVSLFCEDRLGRIWFDAGAAVHAEAVDKSGPDAIYEMLRWTDGEFAIEHGVVASETSIEADTMFVVMEGLRLLDESTAGASEAAAC